MSMMNKDGILYRYYFKHEPEWQPPVHTDKNTGLYGVHGRTFAVIEAIEPDPNCVFHHTRGENVIADCTCKTLHATRAHAYCSLKEPALRASHLTPNPRYDPIVGRREAFRKALDAKRDGVHIWSYDLRKVLWHSFLADVRQPLTRVTVRNTNQRTYGRIHVQV
jgi:hypothetical protein